MNQHDRIFNFSAGPSMLPLEVLERCQKEMFNCNQSGMSVMEMSHRSQTFIEIAAQAESLLREVMAIPEDYSVLFMQGGASLQFAAIPLNLTRNGKAGYVKTGNFSTAAAKEAEKYTSVVIAGSSEGTGFDRIPAQSELKIDADLDYLHVCFNNTIYGTRFGYIPETGSVPLVADVSSCILSEPLEVSKFDMLYGGVQKNIAPAGMAVVIVKNSLLGHANPKIPKILDYKLNADQDSMINTPNCWSIYVTKLVLEHIKNSGGTAAMQRRNEEKAALLYSFLEQSRLFQNNVQKDSRSIMNVIFKTHSAALDKKFVAEAEALGMSNLKGHKVLGGMRASIYNNMPLEGVQTLVNFMEQFEKANG